jgi:hypothetical protein
MVLRFTPKRVALTHCPSCSDSPHFVLLRKTLQEPGCFGDPILPLDSNERLKP